jgi:hypothetical protein
MHLFRIECTIKPPGCPSSAARGADGSAVASAAAPLTRAALLNLPLHSWSTPASAPQTSYLPVATTRHRWVGKVAPLPARAPARLASNGCGCYPIPSTAVPLEPVVAQRHGSARTGAEGRNGSALRFWPGVCTRSGLPRPPYRQPVDLGFVPLPEGSGAGPRGQLAQSPFFLKRESSRQAVVSETRA